MNDSETTKSKQLTQSTPVKSCRSKDAQRRRRREKRRRDRKSKQDKVEEEKLEIKNLVAENLKLQNELAVQARKRKELVNDNINLCKKLDKEKKESMALANGKSHRIIESSKMSKSQVYQTSIDEIDPSLLALPTESSVLLGEGRFGRVKWMLYRGIEVAVKIMKEDSTRRQLVHDYEATVIREIGGHPGIPYVYGICSEGSNKMLVMQCCAQSGKVTTLQDAVTSTESTFEYPWTSIAMKLTEALLFIHKRGFVHNDLKGNNVLLCLRGQIWQPVIIDYGKTVKASNAKAKKPTNCSNSHDSLREFRRKYPHIAPELFCRQMPPSPASDIFSLGVIFMKFSSKLVTINEITAACCQEDPAMRLTAETILHKLQTL